MAPIMPPSGYSAGHDATFATRSNRPLRDLRISVTDRCDFRCVYCMPKQVFGPNFEFLRRSQLLTFEEITRLATVFAGLGVRKLRLTGGEPLLRREVERLVAMLREIDGIEDIALTTNGSLLARKAQSLADAGLDRVTVSLDSIDDEVFRSMNDVDFPVERVLEAIEVASAAGLGPIKVNAVVKRGLNDDGLLDLAEHFRGTGHILRLIEFMDVGTTNGWRLDDVVGADEMIDRISVTLAARAAGRALPRRGGQALPLRRRGGRDRRDRIGHPAVLRRLHPRPAFGRGPAVHMPVRSAGARPAKRRALGGNGRRAGREGRRNLDAPRRSLLRAAQRQHGRAEPQGGDVAHRRIALWADPASRPIATISPRWVTSQRIAEAPCRSFWRRCDGSRSSFPRAGVTSSASSSCSPWWTSAMS